MLIIFLTAGNDDSLMGIASDGLDVFDGVITDLEDMESEADGNAAAEGVNASL